MEQTDHDIRMLVERSANGDAESSKKLYEMLVDKVFAYVRSRTAAHEHAVDVTQEVLIDFFSALPNFTYQSRAQLFAYIFVITRRKLARQYERMKRGGAEPVVFDEESMSPSDTGTPTSLKSDIARALMTLDEDTREIMVLHHWSRYTFVEIALLLNMTESAVRVRHHRALAALAVYFKE